MTRAVSTTMMMLALTVASAYMLPTVPAHRRCPARTPYIQAFAEDGAMAPSTAALSRIQPLTTVLELQRAASWPNSRRQGSRSLVRRVQSHRAQVPAGSLLQPGGRLLRGQLR